MPKYHAFYVWAYGMEFRRESFPTLDGLLALVVKAKAPESAYLKFVAVCGDELDFEPATYVESYRVKEPAT